MLQKLGWWLTEYLHGGHNKNRIFEPPVQTTLFIGCTDATTPYVNFLFLPCPDANIRFRLTNFHLRCFPCIACVHFF